jgi:hypothetical protein
MTNDPEQHGEHSLDEVTAERLLRGMRPSSGATAGEQALGDLLAAASAPPSARELSGETRAVAAFNASRSATTGPRHGRHAIRRHRPAMRPRVSHGVAAAAALGALTIGGVAAAAYTGSLPSSIQRLAHDHLGAPHPSQPKSTALKAQSSQPRSPSLAQGSDDQGGHPAPPGLSVVTPHPMSSADGQQGTTDSQNAQGGPDQLCTAYAHARVQADQHAADNALRKLEKAAGGPQNVLAYCARVWGSGAPTLNPEPHDSTHPEHPPLTSVPANPQGQQSG